MWYENLSGVVSCPENSNINTDGLDSVVGRGPKKVYSETGWGLHRGGLCVDVINGSLDGPMAGRRNRKKRREG